MNKIAQHLVFFDGTCGFCDNIVQLILKYDKHSIFLFAPLQGTTAKKMLINLPANLKQVDSLILIENFHSEKQKFFLLGKGALRICWLLGGMWKLLGIFSFFPSFLYDWIYRLVAKNRHRFFRNDICVIPSKENKHRFLP